MDTTTTSTTVNLYGYSLEFIQNNPAHLGAARPVDYLILGSIGVVGFLAMWFMHRKG